MTLLVWRDGEAVAMSFEQFGAPVVPAEDDYRRAIQIHIDKTAQERGYDSGVSCSSYVNSKIAEWSAQAVAFAAWRDDVWAKVFTERAKWEGGLRPQPSIEEIIAELPAMIWPG